MKKNDTDRENEADKEDEDMDDSGSVPSVDHSLKQVKWLIIILVICAALAFAGYFVVKLQQASPAAEAKFTYNYFDFQKLDGIWYTQAQEGKDLYQIAMRYSPKELEDVKVTGSIKDLKSKWGFFYITFDPTRDSFKDVTMANAEISTKLVQHFAIGLAPGCTKQAQACDDMNVTIVGCENATLPVIYLNQAPGAAVNIQGNCAIVQGEGDDIVRAADRFMYGMYGIMN